jgi:hypothetical protein
MKTPSKTVSASVLPSQVPCIGPKSPVEPRRVPVARPPSCRNVARRREAFSPSPISTPQSPETDGAPLEGEGTAGAFFVARNGISIVPDGIARENVPFSRLPFEPRHHPGVVVGQLERQRPAGPGNRREPALGRPVEKGPGELPALRLDLQAEGDLEARGGLQGRVPETRGRGAPARRGAGGGGREKRGELCEAASATSREVNPGGLPHPSPTRALKAKGAPERPLRETVCSRARQSIMAMIWSPNSLHFTSVAPSMSRAKS